METNPNIISKETEHHHHHIKTNQTLTTQVSTGSSNHKWWNTWWKTKSHSKDVEHRKSSTSASITSNGDFFSQDVSYFLMSYHYF